MGLEKPTGALIANVARGGPADKGGIKAGDVVTSFNQVPVVNMRQLPKIVSRTQIDKEVDVVVMRQGEEKHLKVKVGQLDETKALRDTRIAKKPKVKVQAPGYAGSDPFSHVEATAQEI